MKIKLCILLIMLFLITPVLGATTLSGVKLMGDYTSNDTITFPMNLSTAPSDPKITYQISVMDFGNNPGGGYIELEPTNTSYSAYPYISLDKSEVTILPGQSEIITATIKPQLESGGLYSLINIHPKIIGSNGTSVVTAMNVPIMITITDNNQIKNGTIDKIETDAHGNFTTYITNTGNIHYYGISNTISIVNESGTQIAQSTSEPLITAIVPGGSIKISQRITANFPNGLYKANAYMIDSNKTVIATGTVPFSITSKNLPTPTETTKSPIGVEVIIISIICTIYIIKRKQNP